MSIALRWRVVQAGLWAALLGLIGMVIALGLILFLPESTQESLLGRDFFAAIALGLGGVTLAGVVSQAWIPREADTWFYSSLSAAMYLFALGMISGALWIPKPDAGSVMGLMAAVFLVAFMALQLPAQRNLVRYLRDASAEATLDMIKYLFLFALTLLVPTCVIRPLAEVMFVLSIFFGVLGYGFLVVQVAMATGRHAKKLRVVPLRNVADTAVGERRDRPVERF
ncbi:MAG: hypothetical protein AAGH92_09425 [Planctomycetota bacterium]